MEFKVGNAESGAAAAAGHGVVDMIEWRAKGNERFARKDWKGAIACYSKYIDFALTATENYSDEERVALLYAYSNRAEARLRLEEYGNAVEDCDKALQLHSAHLKSICRKGRALHGLCEYKIACDCFQQALHLSPASNEIEPLYQKSKKLNKQNRAGKFDLSSYFLRGCRPQDSPEVSNYMGPVVIQKSPGSGRGLFATKNVDIGDIIVVENAVAACSMYKRAHPRALEENEMSEIERLKNETVAQVISCAMSSPRIFQQLQYLISDSDIPDMELFQINKGNCNKLFDSRKNLQNLIQLETDKLRRLMELNALLTHLTQMKNSDEGPFDEDGSIWTGITTIEGWGFWALPSFINHSCFPNANCMVVGKAMFIIAARKISPAEEITISYFKTLIPLPLRETFCRMLGFKCECKRCMFERSLGQAYRKLSGEMISIFTTLVPHVPNVSPTDILHLLELVAQVEDIDAVDVEGKKLIHASFNSIYSVFHRFYADIAVPSHLLPTPITVAEAIQHVSPGSDSSFNLHSRLVNQADGDRVQKNILLQKLMEVGVTMIGKHETRVLEALVRTKMEERWIKVSKVWDGSRARF